MPILNTNSSTFAGTLAAGYTQAQLTAFVKSRFAAVGFPAPAAETAGTPDKVGYYLNLNSSKIYGQYRVIFENSLSGTTSTLRLRLGVEENVNFPGFTEIANTSANVTTGATFTLTNTNPLLVYAIPNSQQLFGLVFLENGTTFRGILGIAYPTLESWYNEDLWAGALLVQPTQPNSFWLPSPNPNGATNSSAVSARMGINTFATRNPSNNLAQVIPSPYLTYSSWGIAARFDGFLGISNNSGFVNNDILVKSAGSEEYWCLWPGDNGVVLRSV